MKSIQNSSVPDFEAGDRVVLCETIPAMVDRPDPLRVGMIGTVRKIRGSLGVEFEGHSDTGWNLGLHVTLFYVAPKVHVLDLCERIKHHE